MLVVENTGHFALVMHGEHLVGAITPAEDGGWALTVKETIDGDFMGLELVELNLDDAVEEAKRVLEPTHSGARITSPFAVHLGPTITMVGPRSAVN